jgi:hypothetical protein
MINRRVLLVLLIAAIATLATRVAAPSHATRVRLSAALTCGVERWPVKTLQDRPRLLRARPTTIAHLVGLPRPAAVPGTRLPSERHLYTVIAAVTLVRDESDQDLHVVLRSGSKHMIAEAPNAPFCTAHATAYRKRQMRAARSLVRRCARARVVGVVFWDYYHGQTGVAPNVIELHPILGFSCLSNAGSPPPPPPPPSGGKCAASYPTVCIPPPPPDLDCGDITYRNFTVRWDVADPDPHHFDGDRDGIGCET